MNNTYVYAWHCWRLLLIVILERCGDVKADAEILYSMIGQKLD